MFFGDENRWYHCCPVGRLIYLDCTRVVTEVEMETIHLCHVDSIVIEDTENSSMEREDVGFFEQLNEFSCGFYVLAAMQKSEWKQSSDTITGDISAR